MTNKKSIEIDFNGISLNGKKFKDWDSKTQEAFFEGFKSNTLSSNKYKAVYGTGKSSGSNKSSSGHWTDKFNIGNPDTDNGHWVTLDNGKHIFIKDEKGSKKSTSSSSTSKTSLSKNSNNNTNSSNSNSSSNSKASKSSKNKDSKSDKASKKMKGNITGGAANVANKKDEKEDAIKKHTKENWVLPVSKGHRITSDYGNRMHPIQHRIIHHDGIDINAKANTPVYAVANGTVVDSKWNGGYGNYIEIEHDNGLRTFYGHLNTRDVKVGDIVKQGQTIGLSGNTGAGTGPHLHFGMKRKRGEQMEKLNPMEYLPEF